MEKKFVYRLKSRSFDCKFITPKKVYAYILSEILNNNDENPSYLLDIPTESSIPPEKILRSHIKEICRTFSIPENYRFSIGHFENNHYKLTLINLKEVLNHVKSKENNLQNQSRRDTTLVEKGVEND